MQRRRFLHLSTAGALALGVPVLPALFEEEARLRTLACPGLMGLFWDERVVALGRIYRRQVPEEDDRRLLVERLLRDARRAPGASLDRRLQHLVRQDFDAGRSVVVDGWVLSVTEARQCALRSLLSF